MQLAVKLSKSKERPLGHVTPGGYVKTKDGWRKKATGERKRRIPLDEKLRYDQRTRGEPVRDYTDGKAVDRGQPYYEPPIKVGRADLTRFATYNYLPDDIRGNLKDHQADFVNLAMQQFEEGVGGISNFDATGTGKTRQELALAETYMEHHPNAKVVITTHSHSVIREAFVRDGKALGAELKLIQSADDIANGGPGIYITKYSSLSGLNDEGAFEDIDLSIFDESHNMKNVHLSSKAKAGIDIIEKSKNTALFSATPMDKASHLPYLATAFGLDANKLMRFIGYKRQSYGWTTNSTGMKIADKLDQIFNEFARKGWMIKREVPMEGLNLTIKDVPMPASLKNRYKRALQEMAAAVDIVPDAKKGLVKARWLMTLRSMVEQAKIEPALDAAKAALAEGRQVIIFATRVSGSLALLRHYPVGEDVPTSKLVNQQVAEIKSLLADGDLTHQQIANAYAVARRTISDIAEGHTWTHITEEGKVDLKRRIAEKGTLRELSKKLKAAGIEPAEVFGSSRSAMDDIKAFQSGEKKILITTPQSGGTGISLDDRKGDAPRTTIMMTPPFSAVDFVQILGRVHRLTTKSDSDVVMLSTDTTIDQWNKGIIANKLSTLGGTVQGDYGTIDIGKIERHGSLEDATKYAEEHRDVSVPYTNKEPLQLSQFELQKSIGGVQMGKYTVLTPKQAYQLKEDLGLLEKAAPRKRQRLVVVTKSEQGARMAAKMWYGKKPPIRDNYDDDESFNKACRKYRLAIKSKQIKSKMTKAQISPKELKIGTIIEFEHTEDRKVAKKIAEDHLKENKDYYNDDLFSDERSRAIAGMKKGWPTTSIGEIKVASDTTSAEEPEIPKRRIGRITAATSDKAPTKMGLRKSETKAETKKSKKIGEIEQGAREGGKSILKIGSTGIGVKWDGVKWNAKHGGNTFEGLTIAEIGGALEKDLSPQQEEADASKSKDAKSAAKS